MNSLEHEYTDDVICPYCNHRHADSWEFGDSEQGTCESCGKNFRMEKHHSVTYSTKPLACAEQNLHHSYDKAQRFDYPQSKIDEWAQRGGIWADVAHRDGPHSLWVRRCTVCGDQDYSGPLPLEAPNPWASPIVVMEDPDR